VLKALHLAQFVVIFLLLQIIVSSFAMVGKWDQTNAKLFKILTTLHFTHTDRQTDTYVAYSNCLQHQPSPPLSFLTSYETSGEESWVADDSGIHGNRSWRPHCRHLLALQISKPAKHTHSNSALQNRSWNTYKMQWIYFQYLRFVWPCIFLMK